MTVSVLAVVRADSWDLPLFIHVLGAMVMVGALVLAASYLFAAARGGSLESTNAGFRSLLYAALPAFIVMRAGAEWIADKENVTDSDATWIGIGYMASDVGALLIVVTTIVSGLALRRARRQGSRPGRGATVAAWLVVVLIALYVVAIWAMATKPA